MGSELRCAGPVCTDPESWHSHSRATDCSTWFLKQLVVSNCSFPGVEVAMIVSSLQQALERTHDRPAIQSILDRFGCGLVAVAMESSMDFEGEPKVSRPAIPVKIHRLPFLQRVSDGETRLLPGLPKIVAQGARNHIPRFPGAQCVAGIFEGPRHVFFHEFAACGD